MDEAQAGYATKIDVVLLSDDSVSITDNGRGVCALFISYDSNKTIFDLLICYKMVEHDYF